MSANIQRLLDIMARLRQKEGGCPWDIEQTFESIAPHTIEETYELVEAIEKKDAKAIKEELGDVLLQVVFHAQMAREAGLFDFDSVAKATADKLVERHPHIFGEQKAETANDVVTIWEKNKQAKRAEKAENEGRAESVLDNVSTALPAMTRAVKLQKRAAHVGFDWDEAAAVFAKIKEEIAELETEVADNKGEAYLKDELGDVLFAVTNLARKLDIDPEAALRGTNAKFERRFRAIEEELSKQGKKIQDATLAEMEALWNAAKAAEKA